MKTKIGIFGIFAVIIASSAMPARAQAPPTSTAAVQHFDARWTPYLGCWRLLHENVRVEGATAPAAAMPAGPKIMVCVQPSGTTTGATMTTFADGKQILEQTVVADAARRGVAESGCNGTETSEWSSDGLRLFTHVDLACNDRPTQSIAGLTLFAKGPAWIDIQAMPGDRQQVRIRRYVRTADQPAALAALPAETITRAVVDGLAASTHRFSQNDIEEASKKAPSQVVEAAIVETEARFALDSRTLKQLADAGVSPNVIDLMVAQSFPSHFRVERPVTLPPLPGALSAGTSVMSSSTQYPAQYPYATQYPYAMQYPGQYGTPYSFYPYGAYDPYYYYSYYYSPFAYPYYWGGGTFYRGSTYYITNGGAIVVPNGSGSGSGGAANSDNGHGQLINGLGYTRVHPASSGNTAEPATQHGATETKTVRGSSWSGAASPSGSSSSSGSSGSSSGGSSSGGSSSGGSSSGSGQSGSGSGSSGRTAQPR
jgi:hypothetical protein